MRVNVLRHNGDGRRFYERDGYRPIAVAIRQVALEVRRRQDLVGERDHDRRGRERHENPQEELDHLLPCEASSFDPLHQFGIDDEPLGRGEPRMAGR